jgi:hypothetical protein
MMPAMAMALTMAHGTAIAAFEASSEMCTLASKPQIVHRGARKLMMKANPSDHPSTISIKNCETRKNAEGSAGDILLGNFPRAKLAVFLNSFGVAVGKAMITVKQRLQAASSQSGKVRSYETGRT